MRTVYDTLQRANIERNKEWDSSGAIGLAFRGNEMAGECGEACNVIKKIERERLGLRGSRATLDDLAGELSDLVICAYLTAMTADIDLDKAIAEKFNATSEKYGLSVFLTVP